MSPPNDRPDAAALRAEHDALADRLALRESILLARRALRQLFAGLIAMGFAIALAWDRWGPLKPGVVRPYEPRPPFFMYVAMIVTAILMVLAVRTSLRVRRELAEEDRLHARYEELRRVLGLDA